MASFDVLGLDISGERRRESDQIYPSLSNHPATRVTCCAKIPVSRASWPFHRVNDTRVKGTTSFVLERIKIRCDFSKISFFVLWREKCIYIYIHGRWSDKDENIYRPSVVYSFLIDDGRGKKTFRKKTSARQESKTGRIFYGSEDPRMGNDNNYSHAKETIYRVASVNYVNAIFRYNPCRFLFDRSKRSSIPNSKETIT